MRFVLPRRIGFSLTSVVVLLGVSSAWGQQIVEETSTRFPSPNPSEYTNQMTIGDLDGDTDLDIVFANGGNFGSPGPLLTQRVYINDGSGHFTDESAARLNFFGLCRGVELGDIDNDGDLDMIFAQDFNRLPALFVNDGAGFFTNVTAAQLPNITLSSSRAQFGDIDNDGDLDLYIVSGSSNRFGCGQYRVYVNDGNGFFTDETSSRHPIGNVCQNMDCIFGDIDNDFDLDIRTGSTGSNNSRLYGNDGTGVFTLLTTIPADSTCYSYDFGDIDGDGELDLLGINAGSGSTELLLSNNGGVFTNISGNIMPNTSLDDNDSKFFDYDDDGDLDLIIARLGSGGERVYNNDHAIFTQASGIIQINSDSTLDIMVADLTGNGKLDVVTAQGESGNFQNRIYINNGPADTHAPRIIRTEQVQDTEDTAGPYIIRALILDNMSSDRNFFDKGILLHYSVNGRNNEVLPMRYSGGQVYRGALPGQSECSEVEYWVTATDFNNNTGIGETHSFTVGGGQPGDLDGDCDVDAADLAQLLGAWGPYEPCPPFHPADFDQNCTVGASDLAILLGNWG
ncbi:MAG: VCBS repeat-containing protein [Planctomycetes bacterium]|nr:VCBS repeat-containing protein [Planctomycetota bacterium]